MDEDCQYFGGVAGDDAVLRVEGKRTICKYGTETPLSSFMRQNTEKNFRREATSETEIEEIDRRIGRDRIAPTLAVEVVL